MSSEQGEASAAPQVVTSMSPGMAVPEGMPRSRDRWVIEPTDQAWTGFALSEWELTAAGWSDQHPHSETNYVLDGELHVESGGVTVVALTGDTVTVPAGQVGRYWAPVHARMLAIYGPNPAGEASRNIGYWEI